MSLPPRDEIDPKHRFDLTRIFATPDDWTTARETLDDRLDRLRSLADEPPTRPDELRALLDLTEECYRRKQRLGLYARLAANVNTSSAAAATRERDFRELEAAFEPVAAAVRRRLGALDAAAFDDLLASLDGDRYYARNLRAQAARTREPAVEEAIAAHAEARSAPTRVLRAVTTEDVDPPTVERPDGERVDVRVGDYVTELSHPDRGYRRAVYEAYHGEMERFEATLTRAVAEKLSAAATEADLRGYDSIRDRDLRGAYPDAGLEPAVPEAVHDTLVDGVRDALGPYHRAQRSRRERLGLDALRPWDRRVPTADAPAPTLDYGDATGLILESLDPLGEEYVDRTREFLAERRVDVFPTRDKRTDIPAYCPSSAADGAFVLANFREDVRTTFYVAHELGHALDVAYRREGPTRYATAPTAVCEVPSILHELLLAERCLDAGGALASHARDRLVECLAGNLYRNARSAAFKHALATTVEAGEELSPTVAREAYADLLAEFDPIVEYEDGDRGGREWLGMGMRLPYSSYQYVLGATGALVVRDRLREGSLSPADYRRFLRTAGRTPPVASFESLGIDVRSATPYERAAAAFDGYLDRAGRVRE
ncbi:M3 family oligoendopeptidase [Halomarina pelagica]|uniref:M3 family oligoendopeptidase n=1 Tax=Halomarina pelagica TaxID=2961599 RepID=UPI0020C4E33B|nr:M3 family metallopeptidase [Halomarina sp. BND7]